VVLFHHQLDRRDEALDALAERCGDEPEVLVVAESLMLSL